MQYAVEEQKKVSEEGVLKDEIISFVLDDAEESYPGKLRLITYWDKEQKKQYCFLTNNFDLSTKTIADIYRQRWEIKTFFRWIKQNLKIKTFLGTSKNAVLRESDKIKWTNFLDIFFKDKE
jgi:IS4 transposase